MNRPMNTARLWEMLEDIRSQNPDFALSTDIICGFPGETEEIFNQSLAFIQDCQFSGGPVFPFSALQGTAAFDVTGQGQHSIRRERTSKVRQVLDEAEKSFIRRRLGKTAQVLFESKAKHQREWVWHGWSEDFLKVSAQSSENLHNQIVRVKLEGTTSIGSLIGRIYDPIFDNSTAKSAG